MKTRTYMRVSDRRAVVDLIVTINVQEYSTEYSALFGNVHEPRNTR